MPKFLVPLVRKTVEYEYASVEVEASDEHDAMERALEIAEGAPHLMPDNHAFWAAHAQVEWDDEGNGYGGSEIDIRGSADDVEEILEENA